MLEKNVFKFFECQFCCAQKLIDLYWGRLRNTNQQNQKKKWKMQVPKKFVRYSHQIFYFLLFYISFFTSADINFHKLLELHSTLHYLKKIFSNGFTHPTKHHPFNGQNPLSMMKFFVNAPLFSLVTKLQMLLMWWY